MTNNSHQLYGCTLNDNIIAAVASRS